MFLGWLAISPDLPLSNTDFSNAVPNPFTAAAGNISESHFHTTAMVVDGNGEDKRHLCVSIHAVNLDMIELDKIIQMADNPVFTYHFFIRISPVALDVSEIQPSLATGHDFQIVAWRSPEGPLYTGYSCGTIMKLVDPTKDATYIMQSLKEYMRTMHVGGLFLYIRVPDNDAQLEEIGEYVVDMCALFEASRNFFHVIDIAFTSVE